METSSPILRFVTSLMLCLVCVVSAGAYDFYSGGFYYNITSDNEVEVTYRTLSEDTYQGYVNIPQQVTYNGTTYTVTSVGYQAFTLSTLIGVTIPNTVKKINGNAFRLCYSLETVTMTDAVTEIGFQAFEGCHKLSSIRLSENLEEIHPHCFAYCDSLKSIMIPHSVKMIYNGAFQKCPNLKTITCMAWDPPTWWSDDVIDQDVKPNVTVIVPKNSLSAYKASDCLWSTLGAIKALYYDIDKDGLYYLRNSIGGLDVSFKDNYYNTYSGYVTIPESVTLHEGQYPVNGIGSAAFLSSKNLRSVTIPTSIKIIRDRAFMYCTSLTSITIPGSVTEIKNHAFIGCTSLSRINLNEGLKTIGSQAMANIPLNTITLPASLESIDGSALSCNTSLPAINVKAGSANYVSIDGVLFTLDGKKLVTFPAGKSITSYTVPNGTEVICNNAFDGPTNLTEITLPRSLREIQTAAFRSNTKIREMEIPTGVTRIASSAMDNCNTMNTVKLPSTLTYLGANVFARCSSLNEVYIKATTPPYCDTYEWYDYDWGEDVTDYTFDEVQFGNVMVFVPKLSLDDYKNAPTWRKFTYIEGIWYPNEFEPGDVDQDGRVSIDDVTMLIDILLSGGSSSTTSDVDGDGQVNIDDVTALIDMLLQGH
ncbi:MAG: leucine-rich repeat protein [Muribaculaceae bacterium]|nr:leucine-rich repeat protein [Muribaculaceae bacterium]